ncbi:MAG: hypothetical protein HQL50_15600, partial [Magnetococcales bacterium]|nr:hypothetical protein [Magnetococcales bacterium]
MSRREISDADLKSALQEGTPHPSHSAKKGAIHAALAAFDAQSEKKFQGSADSRRPTPKTARLFQRLGDFFMTGFSRTGLSLVAATS